MHDALGEGDSMAKNPGSGGTMPFILGLLALVAFVGAWTYQTRTAEMPNLFETAVKLGELLVWIGGLWTIVVLKQHLVAFNGQVDLLKQQIEEQRSTLQEEFDWRRKASYHKHFSSVPRAEVNDKMYALSKQYEFVDCLQGFGQPIPTAKLDELLRDPQNDLTVRAYLDSFERFCGAVKCGLVDDDYAYSLENTRVIRTLTIFQPFIDRVRAKNSMGYLELRKLAEQWNYRRAEEDSNFADSRGVKGGTGTRRNPVNK